MKNTIPILALIVILISIFQLITLYAAVPMRWTVDVSRVQPEVRDVVRGETIALEATLKNDGKPFEMGPEPVCIFWQTNGMGRLWWSAPATAKPSQPTTNNQQPATNILSAVFTPAMDPGAATVNGFLGSTGDIYRAAFQLRFRHGPGGVPNELPLPTPTLDFAKVTVLNPPWSGFDTNAVIDIAQSVVAPAVNAAVRTASALAGGVATSATNYTDTAVSSLSSQVSCLASSKADKVTKINGHSLSNDVNITVSDIAGAMRSWSANTSTPNGARLTWNDRRTLQLSNPGASDDIFFRVSKRTPDEESDIYVSHTGLSINNDDMYLDLMTAAYSIDGAAIDYDDGDGHGGHLPIRDIATKSEIPDAYTKTETDAALAAKADSADVTQLGSDVSQLNLQVAALGATANAEDARFVSTNYNSSTRMPEAYVDVKVSNSWISVWREMTRWNWFLTGYANYTNDVASALANKGEKEWGWFDSATGNPSPDGILQLSQPSILICSGAAYQRYATASGAAWVLESNGLVGDINGTTNGFFRISDEEGNAHFEIVKGDKQTLFATARTMTQQQMGVTHYFTTYAVTNAVAQPTAEFTRSLKPVAWIREGDPGFPCNVRWTNSGNNSYTVEWWPIGNEPQLFMRCGYERGGETYIRNNAPVSMDYIYLGGVKYRLGTATVSGHTVLTLTQE